MNGPERIPEWVHFPGDTWEYRTPAEAGLDAELFESWAEAQEPEFGCGFGGQKPGTGGIAIARGGYLIRRWGDVRYRYQSASLGKAFTRMCLQLALDRGLIGGVEDLVSDYWTGAGELDAHKVMDGGFQVDVTFKHLRDMQAGFPVTNGFVWRHGKRQGAYTSDVPEWASNTGDPCYDNYAHTVPGMEACYSSGGYWRLSQALTAIWEEDLKAVLDRLVMAPIGIPATRWEWLSGLAVAENKDFYPDMPGYGDFVDPPFHIGDRPVRGGGGWVVMSAEDFARLGLLIATGGVWRGERLISQLAGNGGVGVNLFQGWGQVGDEAGYFSFGKLATKFEDPSEDQMGAWVAGPVKGSGNAWTRLTRTVRGGHHGFD